MSRDIYETYCNGDFIPDDELKQAIKDYTRAHDALLKMGPAFEITRKEIGRVVLSLEGMMTARLRNSA